jgi:hypothetical protein
VHKITVADLQLHHYVSFLPLRKHLFAYNEVPAIAVAKRLLVQGASQQDAPFFLVTPF